MKSNTWTKNNFGFPRRGSDPRKGVTNSSTGTNSSKAQICSSSPCDNIKQTKQSASLWYSSFAAITNLKIHKNPDHYLTKL